MNAWAPIRTKFELQALRTGSRVWKLEGAFVEDSPVAQAELMATIG